MKNPSFSEMARATRLTRLGRLHEAVHVLQDHLRATAPSMPRPSPPSGGPMSETLPGAARVDDAAIVRGAAIAGTLLPRSPSALAAARVPKPRMRVGVPTMRRAIPIPPGARFEDVDLGDLARGRAANVYVPSSYTGAACPLLVMLHGCTQTPEDFAQGTRMNALAEQYGFVVLYPAQSMRANASRCWNWFSAADQQRGSGEPAWIAEVTRKVMAAFAIDPSRVYVAGLSAGGAMAAILGITYPDVFAAVGVHSGLAVGSAHDVASAFAAMRSGSAGAAIAAGSLPTIVFHGDSDSTVHPDNATFVTDQARGRRSEHVETTSAATPAGVAYERTVETDADGRALLERWRIRGAGHAWSGGSADGSFVAPDGPDASEAMWRFFREHRRLDAGTGSGLRDATAPGPAHTR